MEQYWEWLCTIPGVYRSQQEILLRCFGTPEAVWRASEQELEYVGRKGCRWVERVRQFRRETTPEEIAHRRMEKGIHFISHEHRKYPWRLGCLRDKPFGLFYRGNLPEEERRAVAVVGARMCTPFGREMAVRIGRKTAEAGGVLLSGAAYGIDGAAQWAALEQGGASYAVMGCGPDRNYPPSHGALFARLAEQGGILSEFPPGTEPCRYHFPMRNRIISGLADTVIVVEARRRSGSLITAEFAAEQGKTVMAVPGRPGDQLSEGCNELIAQGAGIVLSADSLIQMLFPDYKREKRKLTEDITLAPAEKLVYSSLGLQPKSLWELEECTALSLAEMSESLMSLELKGLIRETENNCYALSEEP